MLRIAVPNKGSLADSAAQMLSEAGYRGRRDHRELVLRDPENNVELFYLRPRDVATYVGAGTIDVGITGRDLLADSKSDAIEHLPLGFAKSTFHFAAPEGRMEELSDLGGKRIATSYPRLVRRYLKGVGVEPAEIVRLDGAVESSVELGVADAIADVVETGSTLRAAGLEVFGPPLLQSEAVLVRSPKADPANGISTLTRRLVGIITGRDWVLLDYVVPDESLAATVALAPGLESPTVSPLIEGGWSAVRVMVRRANLNATLDKLHDAGARALVVSSVVAARF
ncbi:MAG: ATP phosphoribosyltransferase [Promicromonosporaceae bacterium]|nr:ATP phosphoribosyltransferase [Promicromonosporaceae bacterium]